jgi:hypothetical protein
MFSTRLAFASLSYCLGLKLYLIVSYDITVTVRVFEEEGDCIVCLEIRADKLIRRLILGKLTIYSVVRTSLEP